MLSLRPGASARHLIRHSADRDTPNDTFSSRRRLWANEIRRHDEEGSAARGPHPALRATCPPCGARKTVRAYAIPPVFRPLRKLRPCFFCHLQRKAAIPRARGRLYGPSRTPAPTGVLQNGQKRGPLRHPTDCYTPDATSPCAGEVWAGG